MGKSVTVAFSLLFLSGAAAASAQAVDPKLHGAYAPGGDCAKEPRVTLNTTLSIRSGGRDITLAPLDSCQSCVGGAGYEGIEVWVSQLGPDGMPKQPMFRFNADEKRGVLVVDKIDLASFSPPIRAVAMASPLRRCAK